VRNPFRKRKNKRVMLEDMGFQFKELDARFRRLEETLVHLKEKLPHIIIENVVIQQPVLEKLEFRLDGLDIEHLSGSLNLGNNFGTKPFAQHNDNKKGKETPSNRSAASKPDESKSPLTGLHQTPTGFRLHNRR
jgi:hypothetical protein